MDRFQVALLGAAEIERAGVCMLDLMTALYPICRSITGPGVRTTLAKVAQTVPLQITEVPTGTQVFDWTVPREWSVSEAYIEHESGRRFAEFSTSNLHLMGYSVPTDQVLPLAELQSHLHSLPQHPDWVPFRSSYYHEDWGFCLADRVRQALPEGNYRAVIRSRLYPGSLTLGEFFHQGSSGDEILIFAHTCHPSLCNDNLSGIVVAAHLAAWLQGRRTRLSYRFVFAPATIGSISWMALNENTLQHIRHGLVLAMLGDSGPLHYQRSKSGPALIDRAAATTLTSHCPDATLLPWSPWGFDERQFSTPGINLPFGRLSRALTGQYPQEHTSADALDLMSATTLAQSWLAVLRMLEVLEDNRRYVNLSPKGEPQLGKRGLYRQTGGHYYGVPQRHMALLWLLHLCDGQQGLLDIAERSGLEFGLLAQCALDLQAAGLLAPVSGDV